MRKDKKDDKYVVKKFKEHLLAFLLVGIVVFISFQNYTPGTFLSGWDTLHPEFNFSLYFKRILFSVWQEHQGLGAVVPQAHAAELPRIILYYISSLFLPNSFLRYGYFFLTLISGSLGVYSFLRFVIFKNFIGWRGEFSAFSGGLLYLLNLGTLQHYYVPLEMFATHFATLPWLFLFATKFIEQRGMKSLILFSIITVLSTSMAHTPTLFFAYFFGLVLYIVGLMVFSYGVKFRQVLIILITTLLLNSFWLLPNLYFIANHGQEVADSKIHTQFSEKAFLTSQDFGNVKNTAILKNFIFAWGEYNDNEKKFVDLLDEWKPHLEKPGYLFIGYGIFTAVLVGILISFWQKEKYGIALLPIFLVSFFFIANDLPVISAIFSFLQDKVPLFGEAIRFPFTKFSILLMFTFAVYFAITLSLIFQKLLKIVKKEKLIAYSGILFVLLVLSYYMFPVFKGNLISPSMKVKIPQEYFSLFGWLSNQEKTGRIASLPIHTFWGWVYYDWQYEGAGFLWFGLEQPLLDREFDRWSPYNENYYWEISYALYSQNLELLEKVLEKYQINWLLVDENVINPSSPKALYFDEIRQLLSSSKKISLVQEFGKIKIYKISGDAPVKDFVFLAQNLPVIDPIYKWSNYDQAYVDNGNYRSSPMANDRHLAANSYYPFRSLFTGKRQEDLEFEIVDRGDYFALRKTLPEKLGGYFLGIPELGKEDLLWVDPSNLTRVKSLLGEVFFDGSVVEVKVPKVGGYFSAKINPADEPEVRLAKNCNNKGEGNVRNETVTENKKDFLRLTAVGATNCSAAFFLPNLPHNMAYLITADAVNKQGTSLLFWLENLNSRKADIETYLPKSTFKVSYFIQPPMEKDGMGYALHFDNISVGKEKVINDLGEITINAIPYDFLTGLVLRDPNAKISPSKLIEVNIQHPNPSLYLATIEKPVLQAGNSTLVLSQSYEKGWKTYRVENGKWKLGNWVKLAFPFIFGKEIKEHVLVNNWANGWILDNSQPLTLNSQLVIIYLPQYLEFIGFFLLLLVPVFFYLRRH